MAQNQNRRLRPICRIACWRASCSLVTGTPKAAVTGPVMEDVRKHQAASSDREPSGSPEGCPFRVGSSAWPARASGVGHTSTAVRPY